MTLYRLTRGKYVSVKLNKHGRCAIPKLDMEVGLLDEWARYWYEGELLPLPADLQQDLDKTRKELKETKQRAEQAEQRADDQKHRADELQQRLEAAERELAALRGTTRQQ